MSTAIITSWLLTYLIHSTVLLGAAWLVARSLGCRRLALQEILLRTALIGGLLTTTLQVGLGVESVGGALAIADLSQAEIGAASTTVGFFANDLSLSHTPALSSRTLASWPVAFISLWAVASILALLTLGRSILDLRRLLKTRRFRPTGRLLDRLAEAMGLRKSVRLSTSAAIAVPFATGIKQPEICCPERVEDLAIEHQKSLFAHELAHLARRDPAWQLLYRLGEALLFLQPLNRLVRRRLEEIAEHLTDERAVACTGDRLGLARCLVVVAHWGISDVPGVPATALASGPRLDRRVRHLISGAVGQQFNARWTAPLLIALVAGSVVLLPAVAPSPVHADISPAGSQAVPAKMWSTPTGTPETDAPAAPEPPAVPPSSDVSPPLAPVTDVAPAPDVVPRAPAKPRPVSAPAPAVDPAPETTPDSKATPATPAPPAPPSKVDKPAPEEPTTSERAPSRDEARAREQARQSAERSQLSEAEREKIWAEVRELRKQAEVEARDHMRQAREHMRLSKAEREEMMRRVAELHAESRELAHETAREAREQARKLAEQAKRLAEEAEAERQIEENRRRNEKPE
jgi:beta-lactamase regulating signal transducer with metallopeptidase domain